MKIRTQFILTSFIFAAILAGLGFAILFGGLAIQRAVNQTQSAAAIESNISDLNYLTNDYLLYHEAQQPTRWQSKYSELDADLTGLSELDSAEGSIEDSLDSELSNTQGIFNEAQATLGALPAGQSADPAFVQLYWSRLEIQNQSMQSDIVHLEQLLAGHERSLRSDITYMVAGMVIAFGLFLFANYFLNYRRILGSLQKLQAGTAVIGAGNLDFQVSDGRRDEVGALANAFNRMTADLKQVTASKADLEREIEERKRIEEALKQSEERFFKAFHINPSALALTIAPDYHYVEVNDSWLKLFEYSREEVIGRNSRELNLFPANYAQRDAIIHDTQTQGTVRNVEINAQTRSGKVLSLLSSADNVDINGVSHILSSVVDITARKQAEDALKASQLLLKSVIDTTDDPVFVKDRDSRIIMANPALAEVVGKPLSELIGKTDSEYYDNKIVGAALRKHDLEVLHSNRPMSFEESVPTASGFRTFISSKSPYLSPSGEVVGTLGISHDITERKQLEDAIRDSQEKYRALTETTNDFVWEMDARGRYTYCSPQMQKLWGLKPADMIGKMPSDIMPPDDRERFREFFRDMSAAPAPFSGMETTAYNAGGGLVYIETSGVPFFDSKGGLLGFRGISRDITERKIFQDELERGSRKINEILTSIQDDFYVLNRDWNFIYANRQFTSKIGKEPSDFVGNNIWRMFPKHVGTTYEENLRAVMEKREARRFEVGGKYTDAYYSMAVFPSEEGITVLGHDITDRKQAEEALKQSEERFRSLFEHMTEGLAHCRMLYQDGVPVDWVYLDVNPAFEKITGLAGAAGKNATSLIKGIRETNPELFEIYGRVARGSPPEHFESYVAGLDSWFSVSVYSPQKEYFVAVFDDITSRKQAEESLKKSEQRYRELVENANSIIMRTDGKLNITYMNQYGLKFFGYSEKELIGRSVMGTTVPLRDSTGKALAAMAKGILEDPNFYRTNTHQNMCKGGKLVWVSWTNHVTRKPDGSVDSVLAIGNDISNLKQAEDKVQQMLEESQAQQEELFAQNEELSRTEHALAASRDRFQSLFDFAPIAYLTLEAHDRIVEANNTAASLFGLPADRLVKSPFRTFIPPSELISYVRTRQIAGSSNEQFAECEISLLRADKTTFDAHIRMAPAGGEAGDLRLAVSDVSARKRAEAETRHLASFPALNPDPVVELDASGRIIYINDAGRKALPGLESLGSSHPYLEGWEKMMYDLRHGAPQVSREFRYRDRWFLQSVAYVPDTDSFRFYSRDITSRKQAEDDLRETSNYLNNLFDYANAPIITWDTGFKITRFNHAFERLTGIASPEAIGKPLDVLFPAESRKQSMERIRETQKGSKFEVVEIPIQHRGGATRTVLWNSAPVYAADGKTLVATIAQGQDITERKQAEIALAASEERLRLHAENSPLAIVEWDADFVVTRWAGAAEGLFGWKASETIGRPIMDLHMIYEPDIPIVNDTMKHLSDGTTAYTATNRNVTRDGHVIWCTWYNSVLYDDKGKMRSVMSEVQDVTEAKRLDRAKDEFISLVSHELRNPLTVVLGSVETALSPGLSKEDIDTMLHNAAEGSRSMERIIANLLELSRAQADRLRLAREQIELRPLVEKTIKLVKVLYPHHDFNVSAARGLPQISGDPVRVERVLYNLVENAAKYSPEHTAVEVRLARTDGEVIISVSDRGIGIPSDRIGELFEPFQRLVEQSTHAKGLGLGLVVCKRLVEAHGGRIWAESKENCGTTFYFTLPVR
jgi:PAS domain S-box-containing protein